MSTELRDIDHSYYDAWLGSKSKLGYFQWLADRAEAAAARTAQLQAERDALAAQLATVTAERDELKRKYDRACNYDFLNEALNSGDGVYRP